MKAVVLRATPFPGHLFRDNRQLENNTFCARGDEVGFQSSWAKGTVLRIFTLLESGCVPFNVITKVTSHPAR